MDYAVSAKKIESLSTDCLVLVLDKEGGNLPATLPDATHSQIQALIKDGDFSGSQGQTFMLRQPDGLTARRLLLVGSGKSDAALTMPGWGRLVATLAKAVQGSGAKNAALLMATLQVAELDEAGLIRETTRLLEEANYRFDDFRDSSSDPAGPGRWRFCASSSGNAFTRAAREGQAIGAGVHLARDLGNTPPNVASPAWLAEQARELSQQYSQLSVKVISEKQAERMGMGAFCAVSQGSAFEGKLIVFEYKGGTGAPLALVGKGITFDSGGISIKPGASMDEMKFDMCGAAGVFGAIKSACELNLKTNLVAVVAAAENMPDGNAMRPGDILHSYSGQTIEVLNTDAEGRLVLADALTYVQNKHKPHTIIDMATLTGACVMALGDQATAVYSNDEDLGEQLVASGRHTGDRGWPMPLFDEYGEQLKSSCADMQNIGGPKAGSITAAKFLQNFIGDVHWAHLDIAGTAWKSGTDKGATGRPVPLLTRFIMDVAQSRGA